MNSIISKKLSLIIVLLLSIVIVIPSATSRFALQRSNFMTLTSSAPYMDLVWNNNVGTAPVSVTFEYDEVDNPNMASGNYYIIAKGGDGGNAVSNGGIIVTQIQYTQGETIEVFLGANGGAIYSGVTAYNAYKYVISEWATGYIGAGGAADNYTDGGGAATLVTKHTDGTFDSPSELLIIAAGGGGMSGGKNGGSNLVGANNNLLYGTSQTISQSAYGTTVTGSLYSGYGPNSSCSTGTEPAGNLSGGNGTRGGNTGGSGGGGFVGGDGGGGCGGGGGSSMIFGNTNLPTLTTTQYAELANMIFSTVIDTTIGDYMSTKYKVHADDGKMYLTNGTFDDESDDTLANGITYVGLYYAGT